MVFWLISFGKSNHLYFENKAPKHTPNPASDDPDSGLLRDQTTKKNYQSQTLALTVLIEVRRVNCLRLVLNPNWDTGADFSSKISSSLNTLFIKEESIYVILGRRHLFFFQVFSVFSSQLSSSAKMQPVVKY